MYHFDFKLDANEAKADGNNAVADEAIEANADKPDEADEVNKADLTNVAEVANKAIATVAAKLDNLEEVDEANKIVEAAEADNSDKANDANEVNEAIALDKAVETGKADKADRVNKTVAANEANEANEAIEMPMLLPFSLTKYPAIFTEVKESFGVNNNQLLEFEAAIDDVPGRPYAKNEMDNQKLGTILIARSVKDLSKLCSLRSQRIN